MSRREFGFWSVLGLVIGAQLGSGMMMLPSQLAPFGIWGIVSWLITGSGAITIALVFGILSSYFPQTGGPHVFIHAAFGKRASFYAAWSYWIISWVSSVPLVALAVGSLEAVFGPWSPLIRTFIEIFILLVFAGINLISMRASGISEIICSILKLIPLIAIPLLGFFYWNASYITIPQDISPFLALNKASLLTLWGFIGIEAGTTPAGNVVHAKKTIPKALFFGTLIVTFIYIINTVAVMGVLPASVLGNTFSPYAQVLEHILGSKWGIAASLMVALICLGTLNSWILASGQIAFGAAKERLFPKIFARENRFGSPSWSVGLTAAGLVFFALLFKNHNFSKQLALIVEFSSVSFLLLYFSCILAFGKLMIAGKIKNSTYYWVLLIIGSVFCCWAICSTQWTYLTGALFIPILGFMIAKIFKWPVH